VAGPGARPSGLYDEFGTGANFRNIAIQASPLIIAAVGATFVIMTGGNRPVRRVDAVPGGRDRVQPRSFSAPAGVVFAAIAVTGLLMGLVNGGWRSR